MASPNDVISHIIGSNHLANTREIANNAELVTNAITIGIFTEKNLLYILSLPYTYCDKNMSDEDNSKLLSVMFLVMSKITDFSFVLRATINSSKFMADVRASANIISYYTQCLINQENYDVKQINEPLIQAIENTLVQPKYMSGTVCDKDIDAANIHIHRLIHLIKSLAGLSSGFDFELSKQHACFTDLENSAMLALDNKEMQSATPI